MVPEDVSEVVKGLKHALLRTRLTEEFQSLLQVLLRVRMIIPMPFNGGRDC